MAWLRSEKRTRQVEPSDQLGQAGSPDGGGRAAPPRRRRRWLVTLVILAVGAVAGWLLAPRSTQTTEGTSAARTTFGEVVQTDLQARTDLPGKLAYVADRTVASRLGGREGGATLTGAATPRAIVGRGETMFSIDGAPVVLLLGSTPTWRTLEVGVVGPDVSQLEGNLEALGYRGFPVDDTFTSTTRSAVLQWQRDIGAEDDGVVGLGEVVFLPTEVRVYQLLRTAGDAVASGTEVLAVGATAPVVTIDLETTQLLLVAVGDQVIIRLAGGKESKGTVVAVGQEGAAAGERPTETETVPATISLDNPADAAGLAGSSVTVRVITDTRQDVLVVPVTALLAASDGGYVVEVDRSGRLEAVAVTPGLYDGTKGLVEITGTALKAGDRVVVAVAGT